MNKKIESVIIAACVDCDMTVEDKLREFVEGKAIPHDPNTGRIIKVTPKLRKQLSRVRSVTLLDVVNRPNAVPIS